MSSETPLYNRSLIPWYKVLVGVFFYPHGLRDFVFRRVLLKAGDRVLDAGCGYGLLSRAVRDKAARERLAGIEQHAFDISAAMLEAFRRKGLDGVELRRMDVRNLSYEENYFDIALTSAMLEYVPDLGEALTSLRRCLRPGGRIYVFMSRKSPLNSLLFLPFGRPKCYSFSELRGAFAIAGFTEVERRRFPFTSFWLNAWGIIIEARK